jgi:hypothetical protein
MSDAPMRRLRYPATCHSCNAAMPAGTVGVWNRELRRATCAGCFPDEYVADIDRGVAGRSATRELHRRRGNREQRIREAHPRLGGLILALSTDPQSTTSWGRGAHGERMLGAGLDRLRSEGIAVLHDRRLPGRKTNIDHLLVSSSGVYIVDAKRYGGRVERRDRGGLFRTDYRLYVAGRDRSKLLVGMHSLQVEAVRRTLARFGESGVAVTPVLCFVDSEWGLFASPLRFGDVRVVGQRCSEGSYGREDS